VAPGEERSVGGDGALESELRFVDEHLARVLHRPGTDLQGTLDAIVTAALETVDPARWAGLILVERGRLVPQVTLGGPPHALDALQQRTGTGPCLDAATNQEIIGLDDTSADGRWPEFSASAHAMHVESVLCAPLWVSQDTLGTLSLYSAETDAFTFRERHLVELFATHAALALANARMIAQLRTALTNRDLIGQAKGILMERHRISADAAFDLLSETSQAANHKLSDVARRFVETGDLQS
jgi:GAF domain-containing protein